METCHGQVYVMKVKVKGVAATCILILGSCMQTRQPSRPSPSAHESVVLDDLLKGSSTASRVREVERDLPADAWRAGGHTRPRPVNLSRVEREAALACELLEPLKSALAKMSAEQLLHSLKTIPYGSAETFSGVAYYVYRDGNRLILEELSSRPAYQLESLQRFENDSRVPFTGDSGGYLTVGEIVRSAQRTKSRGTR